MAEPKITVKESVVEEVKEIKASVPRVEIKPEMVEVVPNKDLRCNIADTWYTFKKDVKVKVLQNVRSVLLDSQDLRL